MPTREIENFTIYSEVGEPIQFTGTLSTTDSLTVDPSMEGWSLVVNDGTWSTISATNINASIVSAWEPRPLRMICEYCGCVSKKDYGTCEHCGAPLVPLEYIY